MANRQSVIVAPQYGRSCVAGTYGGTSCTNTQFTKDVSFHYFPDKTKDRNRHRQWVRFVQKHRPDFKPSGYSSLCSVHFDDRCYTTRRDIALQLGIRATLKKDAVPSNDATTDTTNTPLSARGRKQVLRSITREASTSGEAEKGSTSSSSDENVAKTPESSSEGEIGDLKKKIHALQKTNWSLKKEKQTLRRQLDKVKSEHANPVSGKKRTFSERLACSEEEMKIDIDDVEGSQESDTDWSSYEELSCSIDDSADESDDCDDDGVSKNTVSVDPTTKQYDEPKFIVFFGMLMGLFKMFCFKCKAENPTATIKRTGTMATVVQSCKQCGKNNQFKWRSQPLIYGRHPAGNIMMSFSILMSGINISQIFLMFRHMGLSAISPRTYFAHQKKFLFPAIFIHWERYRAALITELKSIRDAQWSGDGRFDSMGHNAKYGVYTMFCNSISKLVHFELLQANQTGSSNAMELAGAKLCFKYLKDSGVNISSFISDRHRGVAKWIRENQTETRHFHDLWHIVKGITKKVLKASKEKGNEQLQVWLKGIRSHLYWCALSSKQGFGDMIVAKWKCAMRHISNIHTNHPDPLYTKCPHGQLERRDWIKPGTKAHERLYNILMKTGTIKDIRMVSSDAQTSCLEGFHSTLNHWHPKMTHYSWLGTYCRHTLAILHFNENLHREKQKAQNGTSYYNVVYPKYKFGEEVVREIAVPPTYSYVKDVKDVLFSVSKEERIQALKKYIEHQPAPLNTQFGERLPKAGAIERQLQRRRNMTQLYPPESEQIVLQQSMAATPQVAPHSGGGKERFCRKCKLPMKGHMRGQCKRTNTAIN